MILSFCFVYLPTKESVNGFSPSYVNPPLTYTSAFISCQKCLQIEQEVTNLEIFEIRSQIDEVCIYESKHDVREVEDE